MKSDSPFAKLKISMMRKLSVTCEDTSPLISELMDHNLPLGKRLRLKLHLAMCKVCGCYQKQLEVIRSLAQKLGESDAPTQQQVALSEQTKAKIKNSLKQSS